MKSADDTTLTLLFDFIYQILGFYDGVLLMLIQLEVVLLTAVH